MEFKTSKDQLIKIISSYQQRSYSQDVDQLLQRGDSINWLAEALITDTRRGVSTLQQMLTLRRNYFGNNEKQAKQPPGFLTLFCEALNDFILKILLVAACLSIGLEVGVAKDEDRAMAWIEGFAILVAVFVVAMVTAVNNYQKQRQFIQLNSVADQKKKVSVIRDGIPLQIHQDFVLVGDVVVVNEGMEVPADGILFESHDITTDQSAMTGETDPIGKNTLQFCGKKKKDIFLNHEENLQKKHQVPSPILMSGTRVLTGQGKMIILVVGPQSCLGKIRALLLKQDESKTPLQQKLENIANDIGKFGLYSALVIIIVLFIRFGVIKGTRQPWDSSKDLIKILDFFIIGITVIVVAIPQGLPLSVTLSLAFSVKKMLEDQNLVRRMQACETMGGANNICSDKTGTLTMNKMILTQIWNAKPIKIDTYSQVLSVESLSPNEDFVELFKIASLVNSTALLYPQEKGSSTEIALLKYFKKMNINYEDERNKYPTKIKYPFSSARKRMSIVAQFKGQNFLFIKGASQMVLRSCEQWLNHQTNKIQMITENFRHNIQEIITEMAKKSLRTLCLGYKKIQPRDDFVERDQKGVYNIQKSKIILISIIGVRDNPRQQVPEAIRKCHLAGITVRMVTGDNIITARAIAKQIGLLTSEDQLSMEGTQFNRIVGGVVCKKCKTALCECPITVQQAQQRKVDIRVDTVANSQQFDKIIEKLLVLARSRPQDKYCLVTGLKQRGNVVAVTGDGTNDAPALKKADVGFAMGISGTQVARQAAAIILIDDNFNSIVKAVLWGRNIYDSIRKFIQFQLTVNVVAVFITLVGAALLQKEVLKPIQMLWINLIMDTLASLALATEDPHETLLLRKPHSRNDYIISNSMKKHIIGQAFFQIIIMLILIFYGENFIPEYVDSLDMQGKIHENPRFKWKNGIIGGTVCSGRFYNIDGHPDYESIFQETKIYSRHYTFIFNTFVMMQVFNFINSRKIHEEFNILQGITKNILFPIIVVGILILQLILISFTGKAFGVYSNYGLTVNQWFISIGFGSISLIVGFLLKLIPYGKQKNFMQVEPINNKTQGGVSDGNINNNKLIEHKLQGNGEYFGQSTFN